MRKDNMSKETVKELLDSITTVDGMTAVKIAMQLNEDRNPTIDGLIDVVELLDKNLKLLATKVLELEKSQRIKMQLAFKFDNWTCPICGQDTKPDWWSEDGYSCMDCGPVLEEEYEEPPLINF